VRVGGVAPTGYTDMDDDDVRLVFDDAVEQVMYVLERVHNLKNTM
jgi:hypothetical protein